MPNEDDTAQPGRPSCLRTQELLLLQSGELDPAGEERVHAHLRDCPACRAAVSELEATLSAYSALPVGDPGRRRYGEMLARATGSVTAAESSADRGTDAAFHRHYGWAVAALLVLAFGAGLVVGRWMAPAGGGPESATSEAVPGSLQASLMAGSAHERLRAAVAAAVVTAPPKQVVAALVGALRTDPSINVRLAVIDALRARRLSLRQERLLLDALADQRSPLLRKALIELFVALEIRLAEPLLRDVADSDPDASVRDRARWAVEELS